MMTVLVFLLLLPILIAFFGLRNLNKQLKEFEERVIKLEEDDKTDDSEKIF